MPKPIDLAGRTFGRLTAISPIYQPGQIRRWRCLCVCGRETFVNTNCLVTGHTKSCGCIRLDGSIRRRHGMKGTKIYGIWKDMRKRCLNPAYRQFKDYGGRGISVCERWNTFENFYADMGNPPYGMSLDRRDVNSGYSPDNCRWATAKQQQRNRTNNTLLTMDGKTMCISEWADEIGVPTTVLHRRVGLGWSQEKILSTPVRGR